MQFAGASGYQADATTGLLLLGHRYYDASIGRFLSSDPAQAGSNWYAYCDNDPLGWVDPTGLLRNGDELGDIEEAAENTFRQAVEVDAIGGGPEDPVGDGFAVGRAFIGAGTIIWIVIKNEEHTKGARPSTEEKHQEAETRRDRDGGNEKADPGRDAKPKRAGRGRSPGSKRDRPAKPPMIHKPKP